MVEEEAGESTLAHFCGDYDFDLFRAVQSAKREVCLIPYSELSVTPDGYYRSLVRALNDHVAFLVRRHNVHAEIKFAISYTPRNNPPISEFGYPYAVKADGDKYYIVIQDEHIRFLRPYAMHMASTKYSCEALGLPHSTLFGTFWDFQDRAKLLPEGRQDGVDNIVISYDCNITTSPQCMAVGTLFWISAVKAIISHEFAHIRNGHISLKKKSPGLKFDKDVMQALEHDADAFSCNMLIEDIGSQIGSVRRLDDNLPGYEVPDHVAAVLVAASTMYYLHRYFHDSDKVDFFSGHPASLVRAFISVSHFQVNMDLAGVALSPSEYIEKIYVPAIGICESALRIVNPEFQYTREMFLSGMQMASLQLGIFDEGWNKIRDALEEQWLGSGGPAAKH